MTPYDEQLYQPPAPVESLTLRTLDGTNRIVANVHALLDPGADITLLPRWAIEQWGLIPQSEESVKLVWFDGSVRLAESVAVEASFSCVLFSFPFPSHQNSPKTRKK